MQCLNFLLSDTLTYENVPVLSYKINYPQFQSNRNNSFVTKLNVFYKENAYLMLDYIKDILYKQAVEQYQYSKENNYPVIPYEAVITYQVTYQMEYYISLFFDKYIFTGGAHGNTVRYSDTWDLCKRKEMELSDFFPYCPNYKEEIITFIIDNIAEQLTEPNAQGTFFETYEMDVNNTFNEDNFYLTNKGIVIYPVLNISRIFWFINNLL